MKRWTSKSGGLVIIISAYRCKVLAILFREWNKIKPKCHYLTTVTSHTIGRREIWCNLDLWCVRQNVPPWLNRFALHEGIDLEDISSKWSCTISHCSWMLPSVYDCIWKSLNTKFNIFTLLKKLLIWFQCLLYLTLMPTKSWNLLRASTNEIHRIQKTINLSPNRLEEFCLLNSLYQIVRAAVLLHNITCLVA